MNDRKMTIAQLRELARLLELWALDQDNWNPVDAMQRERILRVADERAKDYLHSLFDTP